MGVPGENGGPGPFPRPGQKPGNKSLWDAGGISQLGGICLAQGRWRGERKLHFKVKPL